MSVPSLLHSILSNSQLMMDDIVYFAFLSTHACKQPHRHKLTCTSTNTHTPRHTHKLAHAQTSSKAHTYMPKILLNCISIVPNTYFSSGVYREWVPYCYIYTISNRCINCSTLPAWSLLYCRWLVFHRAVQLEYSWSVHQWLHTQPNKKLEFHLPVLSRHKHAHIYKYSSIPLELLILIWT